MMRLLATLCALVLAPAAWGASSILGSKHNLSVGGPGQVRASSEKRSCVFCHVAHGSRGRGENRPESMVPARRYASSTLASRQPTTLAGSSRMCMSCHDGTIALGDTVASGRIALFGTDGAGRLREGKANLGTDLSGSHPVSFRPSHSFRRKFRSPVPGDDVQMDRDGLVQCTSCHDPHSEDNDPTQKKFLVKSNRGSAICLSCHDLREWRSSSHQTSMATVPAGLGTVASAGGMTTVSEMGCAGCHQPHGASRARLVKGNAAASDDDVCLQCHDGRVAKLDLARQVSKPYAHAAPLGVPSGHDAAEGPESATHRLPENRPSARRHVSCVDCHDPHSSQRISASAPQASGALAGVWGIDRNGLKVDPVRFEYEVCFKCHADSANQPRGLRGASPSTVRRAVEDRNLRRVFDQTAASSHPVTGPGRGADVPSLLSPLGPGSTVYCSDCHSSDAAGQPGVPRGPHGSIYPSLLAANYSTSDRTPESPAAYALCYRCHDRGVVLSDRSAFRLHARHVVTSATSCATCHNAHGVSSLGGNAQNNSHLIDFDVNVVRPNAKGLRQYAARGGRAGSCNLNCHGVEHDGTSY